MSMIGLYCTFSIFSLRGRTNGDTQVGFDQANNRLPFKGLLHDMRLKAGSGRQPYSTITLEIVLTNFTE